MNDSAKVSHVGTIPVISSNEGFAEAIASLAVQLKNGTLDHASFSVVNYLREVPGGEPEYMGSTFIIHRGYEPD